MPPPRNSAKFLAIFWGGLACGVLDITQASIAWGIQNHLPPQRIFQSVASGLLGRKAFQGGWGTAALGLLLHFLIALTWAAIYYLASRWLASLTERPVIAGMLYGEFVWLIMTCVVLPLSAIHRWPPSTDPASLVTGPVGHPLLVGLPIALAVQKMFPIGLCQAFPELVICFASTGSPRGFAGTCRPAKPGSPGEGNLSVLPIRPLILACRSKIPRFQWVRFA